jgi:hypothetical protein
LPARGAALGLALFRRRRPHDRRLPRGLVGVVRRARVVDEACDRLGNAEILERAHLGGNAAEPGAHEEMVRVPVVEALVRQRS